MKNKITLELGERSYDIIIGSNIINELERFLSEKKYSKVIIVSDSNVNKLYKDYIADVVNSYESVVVDAGEQAKSFKVLEQVCEEILQKKIDRKTLLIAFGGGPVGLSTLAISVSEQTETIEDVYEPFLIQQGMIARTPRGRVAMPLAYAHLGLQTPAQHPDLFA